jgi:GNAT superfamily N-acetyltransferase
MNASPIEILPLTLRPADVSRFLEVSYGIYKDDPHWVAPLLMDLKKVFTDKNPLFSHAEMALWVARRDGRDVGRIAGVLDQEHNRVQKDCAAFWGYFECIDDREVANRLFDEVSAWARAKGMKRILGPMNPTTNDECGLLIDGFDSPPVFMMTYNPRYYVGLVEGAGFRKSKDLLAYAATVDDAPAQRLDRLAATVKKRHPEVRYVPVRAKSLVKDLGKIKEVYNAAWEDNWGFVPMTDAEIDFMAERLKPLLLEGLVWVAETDEKPIGFLLALGDFNEALKPLRGRLLTPKLLGFIPYLLGWKRPKWMRVVTLGVTAEYRNRGIESVMLSEGTKAARRFGFRHVESSWILENNAPMRKVMDAFNARVYKTYRLYDRDV